MCFFFYSVTDVISNVAKDNTSVKMYLSKSKITDFKNYSKITKYTKKLLNYSNVSKCNSLLYTSAQRSLWLSLAKLSDREKAPLLDAPVSVQGVFGKAVDTMAARFEEQQKSREVFQAWMPRSSALGETSSSGHTTPTPSQKRSGFRSPAPPAK